MAALVLAVSASATWVAGASAATYTANIVGTGSWSAPSTWTPSGVPGPGDTAVVGSMATVVVSAGLAQAQDLTVATGGVLDIQSYGVSIGGRLTAQAASTITSDDGAELSVGQLELGGATLHNVQFYVEGVSPESVFGTSPGAHTSGTDNVGIYQWGGTSTWNSHAITGADIQMHAVATTVTGPSSTTGGLGIGGGSLTFLPQAASGVSGDSMLDVDVLSIGPDMFEVTDPPLTVDWSAGTFAHEDRVNLISAAAHWGAFGGTDTADTEFGTDLAGSRLFATYLDPPPQTGPTVSSDNPLGSSVAASGDTVTCSEGTWSSASAFTFEWLRDGDPIAGETGSTYVVSTSDWGTHLRCRVTEDDGVHFGSETSINSVYAPIDPTISIDTRPPPVVHSSPATVEYSLGQDTELMACTFNGVAVSPCSSPVQLAVADGTTGNVFQVTARNPAGLEISELVVFDVVFPDPVATTAPSVSSNNPESSGLGKVGDLVTCNPGVWDPASTYTYAWKRGASTISGATAATYTLVAADRGTLVSCVVTATAGLRSATAQSSNSIDVPAAPTVTVSPAVPATVTTASINVSYTLGAGTTVVSCTFNGTPVSPCTSPVTVTGYVDASVGNSFVINARNSAGATVASTSTFNVVYPDPVASPLPSVSSNSPVSTSTAKPGDVVTCSPGTWTPGSSTFAYAWKRSATAIAGQSANTYTVQAADVGKTVTCRVTATAGIRFASSDASNIIDVPAAPTITVTSAPAATVAASPATVAYSLASGTTLVGCTLNGAPISPCTSPVSVPVADGTTGNTFVITARNHAGLTTTATRTFDVVFSDPHATTAPSVSSNNASPSAAAPGDTVTCAPGSWTPASTYAFEWRRGAGVIAGQTGSTYVVQPGDRGHELSCLVTATAGLRAATALSANSVQVPDDPHITIVSAPPATVTSASAEVEYTLASGTSLVGCELNGDPLNDCDSPVQLDVEDGTTGNLFVITARNAAGTTTTETLGFDVVFPDPVANVGPAVTSDNEVSSALAKPGDTVTCAPGSWIPASTFEYGWTRDGDPIAGQSADAYTVTGDDYGHALGCAVTATAGLRSATAVAAAEVEVPAAPTLTLGSVPPATITSAETSLSYTVGAGTVITSCALNGEALPSCASPITLASLAERAHTVTLTARNAAGQSVTRTTAFTVDLPDPPPAPDPVKPDTAQPPAAGPAPEDKPVVSLPAQLHVPAGSTATVPTTAYLGGDWSWRGPLLITALGDLADPASWAVRFRAPAAGSANQTLMRGQSDLASMRVTTFPASAGQTSRQLGGATSPSAALTCPERATSYQWWADGRLISHGAARTLEARAIPARAVLWCIAVGSGTPTPVKLLVSNGTRVSATVTSSRRAVRIGASASARVSVTVTTKAAGPTRTVAGKVIKVQRGTTTFKLARSLPASGYTIKLAVIGKGGKPGPQLSLQR